MFHRGRQVLLIVSVKIPPKHPSIDEKKHRHKKRAEEIGKLHHEKILEGGKERVGKGALHPKEHDEGKEGEGALQKMAKEGEKKAFPCGLIHFFHDALLSE